MDLLLAVGQQQQGGRDRLLQQRHCNSKSLHGIWQQQQRRVAAATVRMFT
jgi:hypothetical protein